MSAMIFFSQITRACFCREGFKITFTTCYFLWILFITENSQNVCCQDKQSKRFPVVTIFRLARQPKISIHWGWINLFSISANFGLFLTSLSQHDSNTSITIWGTTVKGYWVTGGLWPFETQYWMSPSFPVSLAKGFNNVIIAQAQIIIIIIIIITDSLHAL